MPEKGRPTNRRRPTASDFLSRAEDFEKAGQLQAAIAEVEKAIPIAEDKAQAYKHLAELHRNARQPEQALGALRQALREKAADMQAREMLLDMLLELGHYDEAIHESREMLRVSPRSLSARDVMSIAYLQKGMLDKALQMTDELIRLDPASPVNHFKKAVLYQQKGDIGNAIHEFSRVLEMEPDPEMARDAEHALDWLDSDQLRNIVMLAVEDVIFRAKLVRDPESAAVERGYYLSEAGMATLKQIQFDDLPEIYADWKQRYYH